MFKSTLIRQLVRVIKNGFGTSSKGILEKWMQITTDKYMTKAKGPHPGKLGEYTGSLRKAMKGKGNAKDTPFIKSNIQGINREIISRYLAAHEYGNKAPLTPQMKRAMFANMKRTGYYKKDVRTSPKPGMRTIKELLFLRSGKSEVNPGPIIKKDIRSRISNLNLKTKLIIGE
jgi:hypothetical protein